MEAKEILDTSVAIEKKEGTITVFTVIEYPNSVKKSFDIIFPETIDYVKAIEIAHKLQEKGKPVGAIDMLIAGMCLNRSAQLLTKDNDFEIISKIFKEFDVRFL